MEFTIYCLLAICLIILLISFFKKDRVKDLEDQVEQLSLQQLQETYLLKKKISVLEEELLHSDDFYPSVKTEPEKVTKLYKTGYSFSEIADQTGLTIEEIRIRIEKDKMRGF